MRPTSCLLIAAVGILTLAGTARAQDKPQEKQKPATTGTTPGEAVTAHPASKDDSSDVSEDPNKRYYFVGLRYRGNIVPAFIEHLFVSEGATVYTNQIGVEVDIRKDNYSLIPSLSYAEYGIPDTLFLQKSKDNATGRADPGNWSFVNSSLKAIYLSADLLWSTKVAPQVDFEYGFGVGMGIVFGSLQNNWVYFTPAGQTPDFTSSDGQYHFTKCPAGADGTLPQGCNKANHQNSDVQKVGGYTESFWTGGGSVPNVFPYIALPLIGFRFKPIKQFEARLSIGFQLTGFFFNLSGNYGLEKPTDKTTALGSSGPQLRTY